MTTTHFPLGTFPFQAVKTFLILQFSGVILHYQEAEISPKTLSLLLSVVIILYIKIQYQIKQNGRCGSDFCYSGIFIEGMT